MTIRPAPDAATKATEEQLVREHLPIVQFVVSDLLRRLPRTVRRDELVSAGLLGLAQAARSFDPSRGVAFGRYARTRINGALLDELRSRDGISRAVRSLSRTVAFATDDLASELGRTPTPSEVAVHAGITEEELSRLNYDVHRSTSLSLDVEIADEMPMTGRNAGNDPLDVLLQRESISYVRDAVATLPERLRTVVTGYFFEECSMEQLAVELGVTESRISQMRAEALALIGIALRAHLGDAQAEAPTIGIAARRRAAYAAAVGTASDYRTRIEAQLLPDRHVAAG